jgi:hypothetical protein
MEFSGATAFLKSTNQCIIKPLDGADVASHKVGLRCTANLISILDMATYRRSEEDERRIVRCAACDGTVLAEMTGFGRIDANTVCASCGMKLIDSPFSGGDYFDVIMRVGRPVWRGARLRRAG